MKNVNIWNFPELHAGGTVNCESSLSGLIITILGCSAGTGYPGSLGSRSPLRVLIMPMRKRKTFEERSSNVCRLRMRIIKTRTERGRPGTEARYWVLGMTSSRPRAMRPVV